MAEVLSTLCKEEVMSQCEELTSQYEEYMSQYEEDRYETRLVATTRDGDEPIPEVLCQ